MLKMTILYALFFTDGSHVFRDDVIIAKDEHECREIGEKTVALAKKLAKHPEFLQRVEIFCGKLEEVKIPIPTPRPDNEGGKLY